MSKENKIGNLRNTHFQKTFCKSILGRLLTTFAEFVDLLNSECFYFMIVVLNFYCKVFHWSEKNESFLYFHLQNKAFSILKFLYWLQEAQFLFETYTYALSWVYDKIYGVSRRCSYKRIWVVCSLTMANNLEKATAYFSRRVVCKFCTSATRHWSRRDSMTPEDRFYWMKMTIRNGWNYSCCMYTWNVCVLQRNNNGISIQKHFNQTMVYKILENSTKKV